MDSLDKQQSGRPANKRYGVQIEMIAEERKDKRLKCWGGGDKEESNKEEQKRKTKGVKRGV